MVSIIAWQRNDLHLNGHCGVFFVQKVQPEETSTKPALQGDDAAHHFLVQADLKQLSLLFF